MRGGRLDGGGRHSPRGSDGKSEEEDGKFAQFVRNPLTMLASALTPNRDRDRGQDRDRERGGGAGYSHDDRSRERTRDTTRDRGGYDRGHARHSAGDRYHHRDRDRNRDRDRDGRGPRDQGRGAGSTRDAGRAASTAASGSDRVVPAAEFYQRARFEYHRGSSGSAAAEGRGSGGGASGRRRSRDGAERGDARDRVGDDGAVLAGPERQLHMAHGDVHASRHGGRRLIEGDNPRRGSGSRSGSRAGGIDEDIDTRAPWYTFGPDPAILLNALSSGRANPFSSHRKQSAQRCIHFVAKYDPSSCETMARASASDIERIDQQLLQAIMLHFIASNSAMFQSQRAGPAGRARDPWHCGSREARECLDPRDAMGQTPLVCSAYAGKVHVARVLIVYGADPNAATNEGWTPLHQAAVMGHSAICALLVSAGADITARTNDGDSPFDVIRKHGIGATRAQEVRAAIQAAIDGNYTGPGVIIEDDPLLLRGRSGPRQGGGVSVSVARRRDHPRDRPRASHGGIGPATGAAAPSATPAAAPPSAAAAAAASSATAAAQLPQPHQQRRREEPETAPPASGARPVHPAAVSTAAAAPAAPAAGSGSASSTTSSSTPSLSSSQSSRSSQNQGLSLEDRAAEEILAEAVASDRWVSHSSQSARTVLVPGPGSVARASGSRLEGEGERDGARASGRDHAAVGAAMSGAVSAAPDSAPSAANATADATTTATTTATADATTTATAAAAAAAAAAATSSPGTRSSPAAAVAGGASVSVSSRQSSDRKTIRSLEQQLRELESQKNELASALQAEIMARTLGTAPSGARDGASSSSSAAREPAPPADPAPPPAPEPDPRVGELEARVTELELENKRLRGLALDGMQREALDELRKGCKEAEERIMEAIADLVIEERLRARLEDAQASCTICLDAQANVCLDPCGHVCMCADCAVGMNECPICRIEIAKKTAVFFS